MNLIKDEINQAKGNEDYYFGNPVNSYLFIKHLTVEWNNIQALLSQGLNIKLQKISFNSLTFI